MSNLADANILYITFFIGILTAKHVIVKSYEGAYASTILFLRDYYIFLADKRENQLSHFWFR